MKAALGQALKAKTPVRCDTLATVAASTSRLFNAPERTTRGILAA
jgi:hypothetical protein